MNPQHDVTHDGITYTVEVLDAGAPARLTGHPDDRQPEEPVEWRVVAVELEGRPNSGVTLSTPLTSEETEALHLLVTEEVRAQQHTDGERA